MPAMESWARYDAFLRQVTRWIAMIGLACLVGLTLATIPDVLMRWLFNSPIEGVHDLYKLVIAVVVGSFFPMALIERHHISITFLGGALGGRANIWLNGFANLALSTFLVLMAWQLVIYVLEVREAGETTWILRWSVTPWWGVATACVILSVPVQLYVTVRDAVAPGGDTGHGHARPVDEGI